MNQKSSKRITYLFSRVRNNFTVVNDKPDVQVVII